MTSIIVVFKFQFKFEIELITKLQRSSHWVSADPQHVSARKSGLVSSVGVVDGISLHERPLFCR